MCVCVCACVRVYEREKMREKKRVRIRMEQDHTTTIRNPSRRLRFCPSPCITVAWTLPVSDAGPDEGCGGGEDGLTDNLVEVVTAVKLEGFVDSGSGEVPGARRETKAIVQGLQGGEGEGEGGDQ